MSTDNEIRSRNLIRKIDDNKHLDLRARADEIANQLRTSPRDTVLKIFWILITIEHAKLYGLGTDSHADREGGWGWMDRDRQFLSSLAGQHMSHCLGIMHGPGRYTVGPLSGSQVDWIRKICSRQFYTLQLALVNPGTHHTQPVAVRPFSVATPTQPCDIPF